MAPFLSMATRAEAQPRRVQAPGWNNKQTTLVGTVTRDLAGDSFELKADNGRSYRVRVGRYDEPRSLDRGDLVRVTGAAQGGVFVARNIEFLRDTRGNNLGRDTLTGTVTRDLAGDSFELRADNGQLYRVRIERYAEPRSLDRGDRVRLTGHLNNNAFSARNIEFLRDTRGNDNLQRTLTGMVTRDLAGDSFELRAQDGRVYRVRVARYDEPRSLDRGDRVRVTGLLTNNVFVARNIEFLRDTRR